VAALPRSKLINGNPLRSHYVNTADSPLRVGRSRRLFYFAGRSLAARQPRQPSVR